MVPYKYGAGIESQVDLFMELGNSIRKLAGKARRVFRKCKKS